MYKMSPLLVHSLLLCSHSAKSLTCAGEGEGVGGRERGVGGKDGREGGITLFSLVVGWVTSYHGDVVMEVQWNVSSLIMLGLNPVHNYEYSESLKLILSTQRFRFWGVTDDIFRTTVQAGSQMKKRWWIKEFERAKPPTIECGTCRAVFSCNWRHGMCALIRKGHRKAVRLTDVFGCLKFGELLQPHSTWFLHSLSWDIDQTWQNGVGNTFPTAPGRVGGWWGWEGGRWWNRRVEGEWQCETKSLIKMKL